MINDHLSPRWQGKSWKENQLVIPHLASQNALFPMITPGDGNLKLPAGTLLLRFHLFVGEGAPNQTLFHFIGRVAEEKVIPLGELVLTNQHLVIRCYANPAGDSFFDAPTDICLSTTCTPKVWNTREIHLNPLPYQQTLGWNDGLATPLDPAKPKPKVESPIARQPTKARWHIESIHVPDLNGVWFGGFELEGDVTQSKNDQFNILRPTR